MEFECDESDKLQITVANKMRYAFNVVKIRLHWGGVFETPYASTNIKNNQNNISAVKTLVQAIKDESISFYSIKKWII